MLTQLWTPQGLQWACSGRAVGVQLACSWLAAGLQLAPTSEHLGIKWPKEVENKNSMVSVLAVSSPAVLRVTLPASAGKRATPPFFFRAAQRGKFGNRGPFLGVVLNKTFTFGRWWVGRWSDSSDVRRRTSDVGRRTQPLPTNEPATVLLQLGQL